MPNSGRYSSIAVVFWVLLALVCFLAPTTAHATVPAGSIVPYGGTTLPAGWLWADGAAANRTTYAELFAAISTTYGAGDGSTTFNVPDLRQRFPLGKAASGTGSTLGGTGGAIDHAPSLALSAHTHGFTLPNHTHPLAAFTPHSHSINPPGTVLGADGTNTVFLADFVDASTSLTCGTGCASGSITSGSGGAQSPTSTSSAQTASSSGANPPFQSVNYIVKTTAAAALPCGALWHTAGTAVPAGSLALDGAAINRTAYSALFSCLGTSFGAGDGASTFNLPDLRQRFALGKAAAGTGSTLGGIGGAIDHPHIMTVSNVSHNVTLSGHSHAATEPTYSHTAGVGDVSGGLSVGVTAWGGASMGVAASTSAAGGSTVTSTVSGGGVFGTSSDGTQTPTSSTGNPPFLVVNATVNTNAGYTEDAGSVVSYGGANLPSGWLWADGAAVSRAANATLFTAIGTSYGAGDGSTTFNVPDLRQRFALGKAASGTGATLGAVGGAIDHTHTVSVAAHTHTVALADTSHSWTFADHTHTVGSDGTYNVNPGGGSVLSGTGTTSPAGGQVVASASGGQAGTYTSSSAGAQTVTSGASNPPYVVVNYIIKSAAPSPTVTSTTPGSAPQGRRGLAVQVNGTGFVSGATVAVSGTGISITSTTFVSATRIDIVVDVTGAATISARDITVTNPDTSTGTGTGVLNIVAPSITLALSTLGFSDAARNPTAPYTIAFGMLTPGMVRSIGPAGSGQTLAGPAVQAAVTSDTNYIITGSAAAFTGPAAFSETNLAWQISGGAGFTSFTTSAVTMAGPVAPGTQTTSFDLRLTAPALQAAGTYSTSTTFTVVAQP